jgi:serpin B
MFTEEADLSGVAGVKGDLFVSEVIQKSFLDVSEDGVEAAAAVYARNSTLTPISFLLMYNFSVVPVHVCAVIGDIEEFYANHPFLFYIKIKGVIIFAGRVIDPTNGSGVAYVPQLVKTKSSRRNYFSQLFSCCRP